MARKLDAEREKIRDEALKKVPGDHRLKDPELDGESTKQPPDGSDADVLPADD